MSNTETVWQFYAATPKIRRQALARRRTAGNRFFATAKAKRKKFYFEAETAGPA
ncbi:hypothetical protein [Mesorhizobium sp. B2-7-2]|uniref:hypothetical protein n=1 Tax=Mesorhizobium sp. B2-7-2 TaxID=2589908 RepID=UPI0015E3ED07|nr:hypothetical protein [Mesorhizobium sp. B2-7-2]